MSSKQKRRGPLSAEEQQLIRANAHKEPGEIAALLNRTPGTIEGWMDANLSPADRVATRGQRAPVEERLTIRAELKHSRAWAQLTEQFTEQEVAYFEEEYVRLMEQFSKDEIWATENTQVMLLIKYQILMDRNLAAKKSSVADLGRLVKMRDKFIGGFEDDPAAMSEAQQNFLMELESQINGARAALQSATKEFNEMEARHQALMKDLKGTRDQRIKRVEGAKESFLDLIKKLQIEEERQAEGKQMELMKRATDKEWKRMGSPHRYEDKNEDQPVLSAETVEMLDENARREEEEECD
jgi:hypothetical protein